MPALEPYAEHQKAALIAALSTLPDGVQDFLTTELPTAPTISTPSDVDAAIIANGIAAKFVCDLFQPFAGLTPISMVLRIGQLNEWLQAGVLAGLQAIEGLDDDDQKGELVILAPKSGTIYAPGDISMGCRAKKGVLTSATVTISGQMIDLYEEQGAFWGVANIEAEDDYTADFLGAFDDDRPIASQSVPFSVEADGEPPDTGDNLKGLDAAKKAFTDAARDLISAAAPVVTAKLSAVAAAANKVLATGEKLASGLVDKAQAVRDRIAALLGSRGRSRGELDESLLADMGDLQAEVNNYCASVVAAWEKTHPHPPEGYAVGPEALRGARKYANAKYGAGSVIWP